MRILLICKAFYPNISPRSFRATELATEFARQGHEVTVLFPKESVDYSEFERIHNIKTKDLGSLKFIAKTNKCSVPIHFIKRALHRVLQVLFDFPDIQLMFKVAKALKDEKGYDLLISIAVPHSIHWGVAKIWREGNKVAKKWIADCGDPFMGAKLETFRKPFYFKYFEKDFCRKADYITVPAEGAKKAYYSEFLGKIRVIPQGFNFEESNFDREVVKNPIPTFAYAGGLADKGVRNPEPLLHLLSQFNLDFRFHVYSGNVPEVVKKYKKILGLRLIIHPKIERKELLKVLCEMDFLINMDNGTSTQVPSKLIDYALTGKPILNFNPAKPDYSLVEEFLNSNYERALQVGNIEKFNIRNVANGFLNLL